MRIAYLVNRYPAVSHSFIRREIVALEDLGATIERFSIRPPSGDLPDPSDRTEAKRTRVILDGNWGQIVAATIRTALERPGAFLRACASSAAMTPSGRGHRLRAFAYVAEACWLLRQLRHSKCEHVHAHFGTNPAAVARLVRQLGGPPYSFTVHGPDEFDDPQGLDLEGKMSDAAFAVAISSYGRAQLMRWSDPKRWRRIHVVRCGVDQSFLQPATEPPPTRARFCCVARLSGQKGLPLLIEAVALLGARGVDMSLDILGEGELKPSLQNAIAAAGLQHAVALKGSCDSTTVRDHLYNARALALASFAEGLPVVIMEALAVGTPVIVTAIAGIPELVDGDCGWVVASGSAEAIAGALEQAINADRQTLDRMGIEGRKRVALQHDANRNAAQLLALMQGKPL